MGHNADLLRRSLAGILLCLLPACQDAASPPPSKSASIWDDLEVQAISFASWSESSRRLGPRLQTNRVSTCRKVREFLRQVDGSQAGHSLETIKMIRPDIDLEVVDSSGTAHRFELYWGIDSLIDHDDFRMLDIETGPLRKTLRKEMQDKAVEGDPAAKLEYHRRLWRESRTYTYVFRLSYASGGVLAGETLWKVPLRIYVRDGSFTAVRRLDTGGLLRTNEEALPTMEGLFDIIQTQLEKAPRELRVKYHPKHPIPQLIDVGDVTVDHGFQYSIGEFRSLTAKALEQALQD